VVERKEVLYAIALKIGWSTKRLAARELCPKRYMCKT